LKKLATLIEVPVLCHEREWYLCVRGVYFASLYDFSFGFWNCFDNFCFPLYFLYDVGFGEI